MSYLSAFAVVIHYEEALYQVYAPLPLPPFTGDSAKHSLYFELYASKRFVACRKVGYVTFSELGPPVPLISLSASLYPTLSEDTLALVCTCRLNMGNTCYRRQKKSAIKTRKMKLILYDPEQWLERWNCDQRNQKND